MYNENKRYVMIKYIQCPWCVRVWENSLFHNSRPLTIFTKFGADGIPF